MATKEQRNEKYAMATATQLYLYEEPASGAKLKAIADKFALNDSKYPNYALIVGDTILGLRKITELSNTFANDLGLTSEISTKLVADIADFLAPLEDPNFVPPVSIDEESDDNVTKKLQDNKVEADSIPENIPTHHTHDSLSNLPIAKPQTSANLSSQPLPNEPFTITGEKEDLSKPNKTVGPAITPLKPLGTSGSDLVGTSNKTVVSVPPPNTKPTPLPTTDNNTPQKPPTLPTTDVTPIRTMSEDVDRIHGYGAYQEKYPHLYSDPEKDKAIIKSVAQDSLLKRTSVVDTPNFSTAENKDGDNS
ncbi:hypothetical protein KC845_00040 [Candidatus Kaiserbacteria bacterium]|nr:hypothetical protein [Candidatus Kaiserbacteria bacterium]